MSVAHLPLWPVAGLVLNSLVWGLSWYPFQRLYAQGVHPLWATFFIYAVALLVLCLLRPAAWRSLRGHSGLWWLALAGGLTNIGFNWAVATGDVVRVVLLFYLMPAWVVVLAWVMLGERPTPASLCRVALALTGVAIVLKAPDSPWPVPSSLADGLAILGSLGFAWTSVWLRKLRHTPDEARIAALFGGSALVPGALVLVLWAAGGVQAPPALAGGWWVWVALTGAAILLGNFGLQYGAARLTANATSLIMLTELIFASVSSVAMGAAEWNTRTTVGGGLIMLAALWAIKPVKASAASAPPPTAGPAH
jgi:drug/metabolite transporter (DMT)-like permease